MPSHVVKACDHVSKVNKNLIQKYHEEWWCAWYVNWLLREKKTCNWWKADHQTTARAKTIEINFEKLLQFYYVNCEKNEYDNNRFSWIVHGIKPLRIHVMNIRWKFIDDYLNNIELNKNILDGFFHHFLKFLFSCLKGSYRQLLSDCQAASTVKKQIPSYMHLLQLICN